MQNKITLACNDCGSRDYSTMKNKNVAERLVINKFCKTCNKHTAHRETK